MVKELAVEHHMFADSMLETSWAHRSRQGWSTLTSFGMQFVLLGLVILLSILKSVVAPAVQTISTPVFLGRLAPAPSTPHPHGGTPSSAPANPDAMVYHHPSRMPIDKLPVGDEPSAPGASDPGLSIFGRGSGSGPGIPSEFFPGGTRPMPTVTPQPVTHPLRISRMSEGSLVRRVQPVYPALAKTAHVQGAVVLAAIISREGTIEDLRLLSGHPLLVPAAIDAVKQWRYKPYVLNGDTIEVETQITVNFYLSAN